MTISGPTQTTNEDRAQMFQLEGGAVHIKGGTVFEMPGIARRVLQDSNHHWRLGGLIATIALIGTTPQIALYVQQHGEEIIRNDSHPKWEMPNITAMVSVSMYGPGPGRPTRVLDPVGDSVVAIVKGLTSFVPASGFAELVMGFADLHDAAEAVRVKPKPKRTSDLRQITFCVAPESEGIQSHPIPGAGPDVRGCQLKEFVDGIVDGLERIK